MKIVFARRNTLGSWLLRFFTWSPYSHVGAIFEDNHGAPLLVVHSTSPEGVHVTEWDKFSEQYNVCEVCEVSVPNEDAAFDFLQSQIGKPYDWSAILGFIFRASDWERDDAWFCNELVEAALVAGGKRRFRESLARITPRHSWMVTT